MDVAALGRFIDEHFNQPGHRLFRMESLPAYAVESDGDDYLRWLDGATEPTWERKQPWLDTLRRERDNNQISSRVRLLSAEVSPYERYACEFGYAYNSAAGEDIRVLHRGEHTLPTELVVEDFWIINDAIVVPMHYGDDGRFLNARVAAPAESAHYLTARDAAWATGEPFATWWARHPELYRDRAAPAR